MLDFEVQRCTRRCAASGRELRPGERCVSVLIAEGAQVVRYDYAADAWQGPPENCVGWWSARVPDGASQRVAWAPNDVMLDYFERLEGQEERRDVRYVLTLLLIRRRLLRLESTATEPDGQEVAVVYCARNEREYRVAAILPDEPRVREIQSELSALLFGGASQTAGAAAPVAAPVAAEASAPAEPHAAPAIAASTMEPDADLTTMAQIDHVIATAESMAAESMAVESMAAESTVAEPAATAPSEATVPSETTVAEQIAADQIAAEPASADVVSIESAPTESPPGESSAPAAKPVSKSSRKRKRAAA